LEDSSSFIRIQITYCLTITWYIKFRVKIATPHMLAKPRDSWKQE